MIEKFNTKKISSFEYLPLTYFKNIYSEIVAAIASS